MVRAPLELGTYYHYTPTSHTRDTDRRVDHFITISPSRTHVLPDSCDFRLYEGAFFEANRDKNHTLYLYLPELLICVKRITEVVFYFVFSFSVKEGSKNGLMKERIPIESRQLLYQLSLKPHFLLHGATVTYIFCCNSHDDTSSNPGLFGFHTALIPLGKLCI